MASAPSAPSPAPPVARCPTHEGNLSHAPRASLRRIAADARVAVDDLATLIVRTSASALFSAVVAYASHVSCPRSAAPPLVVQHVVRRKDEDDAHAEDTRRQIRAFRGQNVGPAPGHGLRKPRAKVPVFELGTAETSVCWPPPKHLTAHFLRNKEERERAIRKDALDPNAEPNGPLPDHVHHPDQGELEDTPPHPVQTEPDTIYIVCYTVGSPQPIYNSIKTYDELVLVSAKGADVLRNFTVQVLQWVVDQESNMNDGTRFKLHRFKLDNCGKGSWEDEGYKRARPLSSVILPEGQSEAIMADVRNFISSETKQWYVAHGLPHRRSYMFYGPPGTGKTSMIRAIASSFGLNCCYLSMVNKKFSNQLLGDALSQIPSNALIVLEDVDALFNENRESTQDNELTFSGLLNALDGLISSDGVLTVMTTNHMDRLDKALIRGGRVDRRFHFAKPTDDQLVKLFQSFYPESPDEVAQSFLRAVCDNATNDEGRAISTLQQLFIDQRRSSDVECVAALPAFFETHFPKVVPGVEDA